MRTMQNSIKATANPMTKKAYKFITAIFAIYAFISPLPGFAANTSCPEHYAFGEAPAIINSNMQKMAREICYSKFGVMHSGLTRTPLWSAEHLTKDSLYQAKTLKRVDSFHEEERLPVAERAELRDFSRSGYDRGHMSPNGDMPDSISQGESFTLANMIAQDPNNNRGLWSGIESAVRAKAKQDGELYVITGPLFIGSKIERLNGRVLVPTHIYKAIYDPKKRAAAAYLVMNAPGLDYEVVSIADLENRAGINLFPSMSVSIKTTKFDLPQPILHGNYGASGTRHKENSQDTALNTVFKQLFGR